MARTYPLTVGYNESMGSKENPLSFDILRLVDLRNGQSQYLSTMKQFVDALPKTWITLLALRWEATSPVQDNPTFATPCEPPCGSCCLRMGSSAAPPHHFVTNWHARDKVWSYMWVMLPDIPWNAALIGSPTQHPHLPEIMAKKIIPLHLNLPSYPERWGPEEERKGIISSMSLETHLEQTSDPRRGCGLQWSIPSFPSIRSIPAQQPMRIRPGLISRTRMTTAVFISRSHQAEARNPQTDLVETTFPGHLPPSALSGHIETTSLGHPIGQ